MINFTCQLDWATGYPDIWLSIILSMSVRAFLGETTVELVETKADFPPQCTWVSSNPTKA